MRKITLLIVDDEYRIGQLIARLVHWEELNLEQLGVFDNSEQAYGAILLNHPDIVISDIKMPVMDGLKLVQKVQESNLHPHFIFISGFREFEYAHTALKYGVEDYLLKPVKEEELNAVLAKVTQTHAQSIQKVQEEKRLKEAAHLGQLLSGADAVAVLEQPGQVIDWDSFNRNYHSNVRTGKLLAVMLWLDYDTPEEKEDIQDRLVINNMISMTENRLRPSVQEQLYAIVQKCGVLFVLNYAAGSTEEILRELHTVFSDVKQYLMAFTVYRVTMAIGEEVSLEQPAKTIACAKHRARQRILLGVDRIISGTEWTAPENPCVPLSTSEKYQLQNAVEAFSDEALTALLAAKRSQLQNADHSDPVDWYRMADDFTAEFFGLFPQTQQTLQKARQLQDRLSQCWTAGSLFDTLQEELCDVLKKFRAGQEQKTARPIRETEKYVAEHYAEKITLEEIAAKLQMNPSYFSALFKKQTGKNFQNYLQDYRIEKAKELLRTTNETMMSIAERVGYTDTRYFSQCFAKVVGVKPSIYRKMYS